MPDRYEQRPGALAASYVRLYGRRAASTYDEQETDDERRQLVLPEIAAILKMVDAAIDAAKAMQPDLPPCPCDWCVARRGAAQLS